MQSGLSRVHTCRDTPSSLNFLFLFVLTFVLVYRIIIGPRQSVFIVLRDAKGVCYGNIGGVGDGEDADRRLVETDISVQVSGGVWAFG